MGRTMSNHGSNKVKSWVEQGRIMSRTGSNHGSNGVGSWVERCGIMPGLTSKVEQCPIKSNKVNQCLVKSNNARCSRRESKTDIARPFRSNHEPGTSTRALDLSCRAFNKPKKQYLLFQCMWTNNHLQL